MSLKKIIKFIISYISLISVLYVTNTNNNKNFINNLFIIAIFVLITYLIQKYLEKNKENNAFIIITSLILSITTVIGFNLTTYDDSKLLNVMTYISILGLCTLFYSIINFVFNNKNKIGKVCNNFNIEKINNFLFKKHTFIKIMVIILLAWIPILLAFYPGVFSYDSSVQLNEFLNHQLSNNNPMFHTVILGTLLKGGKILLGDYSFGVLFYSIFQMLLLSSTMAYIISYLNKKNVNFLIKIVTLIIFMFLPTHSVLSITTTKDVFFSCMVAISITFLIDMVLDPDVFFSKGNRFKNILLISIFVLLMFVTRHNGLYGFAFLSIFLIILMRKYFKYIILIIAIPIVLYQGYLKAISSFSSNTTDPNGFLSAALCVPTQQLARVYNYAKLTNTEKQELNKYVLKNNKRHGYKDYEIRKSDQVMWNIDFPLINQNKKEYLKTYVKYGIKYPIIYTDAFLQNTIGYWYIGDKMPDKSTYRTYIEIRSRDDFNNTNGEIKFDSKNKYIFNKYYNMLEKGDYQKLPIISLFMNNAIYNLMFIIMFIGLLIKKKYKKTLPIILIFGLMITNILGPVSLLRYCYYLYLICPLFIYLYMDTLKSK